MTFQFKEKESILYDFCMFPKLLYVLEDDIHKLNEVLDDDVSHTFVDHDAYIAFIKSAKKDLDPYKDPLLGFYADETISNYDFPVLLFKSYSFLGFEDYRSYLDMIMEDDEAALKQNLIYALLTVEEGETSLSDQDAHQAAAAILSDRDALMQLIRKTPTTENHRWILMLLIDSPKAYLDVYRTLLDKIKPIFDRYLADHQTKINQFKATVVTPLETDGQTAFTQLTYDIVPIDVLDEHNKLLTSFVNPYRFSILTVGQDRFILFSLDMKTGFAKIAQFEQNSRKNRAKVFKTLSDETRYDVLRHLAKGVTSTKVIANALGVSSATITYHINAFLTAKVIKVVKSKDAKYVVDFERLETFWLDFMRDLTEPSNL